jgi:hypothetical protein
VQLHITINGKWIDAIPINSELRSDRAYMDQMKEALLEKYLNLPETGKAAVEFYVDPYNEETPRGRSFSVR